MKYLLLVHHNEQILNGLGERELGQMRDESVTLCQQLAATSQFLNAAPLHPTATATCVRVRDGKRLITDGPYAETREQLGGYFFVTADDEAAAVTIATKIPGARIGTVEVRPIVEVEGLPEP